MNSDVKWIKVNQKLIVYTMILYIMYKSTQK